MDDPETVPEIPVPEVPVPEIPGAPIGRSKPDETPAPVTNPDFPELQDRRRPRPLTRKH